MIKMLEPDPTYNLLYAAIKDAFTKKTKISNEELPQGVSGVEYWHPGKLGEWFHILRDKVIVAVDGLPIKEYYQKAAESLGLMLEDRADVMFQSLAQKGEVRFYISRKSREGLVASVSYVPKMYSSHEVTIYGARNAEIRSSLLLKYMSLQRQNNP